MTECNYSTIVYHIAQTVGARVYKICILHLPPEEQGQRWAVYRGWKLWNESSVKPPSVTSVLESSIGSG